jgi:hypothetical protein
MYHYVARSKTGLMAGNPKDAAALWTRLRPLASGCEAMCLMPNHIHLLTTRQIRGPLAQVLAGHARSLNHAGGRVRLESVPHCEPCEDPKKIRRQARYIHLNPCRARLVEDPLAWTWSTYRDCIGLSARSVRGPVADIARLHSYVSSDPSVATQGSELPNGVPEPNLEQLRAAVSEWLRVPMTHTLRRTPARRLWLSAAKAVVPASDSELARRVGVNRSTLSRTPALSRAELRPLLQMAGDPRFPGLL